MYENFQQETQQANPYLVDYMKDHKNKTNLRLHIIGIGLAVLIAIHAIFTFDVFELIYVPIFGFGFAWIGHFLFEHNKPYFTVPQIAYSVKVNLILLKEIAMRKRSF